MNDNWKQHAVTEQAYTCNYFGGDGGALFAKH